MKRYFQDIEKEQFNVFVPAELPAMIREKARQRGWSVARVVTQALSIGLGIDPAEYGIEAEKQTA